MRFSGLPEHHPAWLDILAAVGEDVRSIDAPDGRLLYTVTRAEMDGGPVTVVNSLPFIAYGGPATADPTTERLLLERLRGVAEELDADVLSVGTSPLLSEAQELVYREILQPTHSFENRVQLQSLATHPLEQLSRKRRVAMESEIRRGERANFEVIDLDERRLEEWLTIYRERYAEIGALPYPEEFHRQLHRLGIGAGLAELRGLVDRPGGPLLGAIVFLVSDSVATYFSSAFVSEVRQLYPTTFLLNAAFDDFHRRGVGTFNWHSSPAAGGVYAYKQRWGARSHRHFYLATLRKPDTRLFRLSTDEVRRLFPFRFVLPFSAWPAATMP